jgi:hypothetical protein
MRMQMRRFTRLTNGFSKKAENHGHAVHIHFLHYNFCRIHQTLRITPLPFPPEIVLNHLIEFGASQLGGFDASSVGV